MKGQIFSGICNCQCRFQCCEAAPRTEVDVLTPAAREEEIARMLAGAEVTEAARAAARALIGA